VELGRIDLAYEDMLDHLKPINWLGSIDKNDVKASGKLLSKGYLNDQKGIDAESKKLAENIKIGNVEGVLKSFSALSIVSIHEIKTDVDALKKLILSTRREYLRLRNIKANETVKAFADEESNDMRLFEESTKRWFDSAISHASLTMHLSDIQSLRAEIVHLLDVFNLQAKERVLQKEEARLLGRQKRHGEKAEKKEDNELKKLKSDLEGLMKGLNLVFTDVIKLMQLEIDRNNKNFEGIITRVAEMKYPKMAELETIRKHTDKKFEQQFLELEEQINALINVERSR
jgi:hypothetical protein